MSRVHNKDRREYRTMLNVCGQSRTWNVNIPGTTHVSSIITFKRVTLHIHSMRAIGTFDTLFSNFYYDIVLLAVYNATVSVCIHVSCVLFLDSLMHSHHRVVLGVGFPLVETSWEMTVMMTSTARAKMLV